MGFYHEVIDQSRYFKAYKSSIGRSLTVQSAWPTAPVDDNDIDIIIEQKKTRHFLQRRQNKFRKYFTTYNDCTEIQGTKPVSMKPWMMILVGLFPLKGEVVMDRGCERLRNLCDWVLLSRVLRRNLVLMSWRSWGRTLTGRLRPYQSSVRRKQPKLP